MLAGCQKEPPAPDAAVDVSNLNAEKIEHVDVLYSDSSIVRVRIQGPVMINHTEYNNPYQEFLEGIRVQFFDNLGNVTSVLTAAYAIRYESRGVTILRNNVLWKSTDQKSLETPELTWDERQQLVFSKKFSVVTTPLDTVYSHGFEASQDFKNIKLSAIDGSVEVEEN